MLRKSSLRHFGSRRPQALEADPRAGAVRMQRAEGDPRPRLVLEVRQPYPYPLAETQVDAGAGRNYKVVAVSAAIGKVEPPSAHEHFSVGDESLGAKRPPRPGEQCRLALARVGIDHPAGLGF